MPEIKTPLESSTIKTVILALVALVVEVLLSKYVLEKPLLDNGTRTTIILGAIAATGFRFKTDSAIRLVWLLIPALLLLAGCARNTNSVSGNGTGLVFVTPFGEVVLGNASFHSVTSDLADESLRITDTTYYDASGVMGLGENGDANAMQKVQRTFTMTLVPVEGEAQPE